MALSTQIASPFTSLCFFSVGSSLLRAAAAPLLPCKGWQMGTATPPCPDHAGSAPNTLTGAEVVLLCRMFLRRRIGRIELTIHASGGRHRGSHRAAVVAYVLLIFGSSKTPVGRTSPYVPRVSACSRKYRLQFVSL